MESHPLNLAHQQHRRAEAHLINNRYDEAMQCHHNAAELLLDAMKSTTSSVALESITLQHSYHLKQKDLIKTKKEQYGRVKKAMDNIKGALALLASAANLWGAPLSSDEDVQRRNLMEDWDGYEAHSVGPTPAVPTLPPYTPSADYLPTIHPPYAPPVLGTQQYFPFDDLSVLPPPPPYSP